MERSNHNLEAIRTLCLQQTCGRLDVEKVKTCTTTKELIDYMHSVYSPAIRLLESKYIFG